MMKAVGFTQPLPISNPNSLIDFEVPIPGARGHDLLVEVSDVAVNPIDVKQRTGHDTYERPRILGYDAYGVVKDVGEAVTLFKVGDPVFYAGAIDRPGSNAEFQLVDERIVGNAPKNIASEYAAAMPLTSLTAYEALFEQLGIEFQNHCANENKTILIINGAGGVGSVAIQLAKLAGLKVIATAGRPESRSWCTELGADAVIGHSQIAEAIHGLGYPAVDYILNLSDLNAYWAAMAQIIKPAGKIAATVANQAPIDLKLLKEKRVAFAWEDVFSKSRFPDETLISQHWILNNIAALLDGGELKSTLNRQMIGINANTLRLAHSLVESHELIGKLVVTR